MPRRTGAAKKVFVQWQTLNGIDFVLPTDTAWKQVEHAFKSEIPDNTRDHLTNLTIYFAFGGWSLKKTVHSTKLVARINLWQKQTTILHRLISGDPISINPDVTYEEVIKRFTLKKGHLLGWFSFNMPLLHSLRSALDASSLLIREISDPSYVADPGPRMWSLWVVLLARICGLPVQKGQIIHPGFIALVEMLQGTLPPGEQRRRKGDSLRKGVKTALKKFKNKNTAILLTSFSLSAINMDRLNWLIESGRLEKLRSKLEQIPEEPTSMV